MERTEWNQAAMDKAFLYRDKGDVQRVWKADRTRTVLIKKVLQRPIYFNVELLHDAVWDDF